MTSGFPAPYEKPSSRRLWYFAAALLLALAAAGVGTYFLVRPEPVHDAGRVVGYTAPPAPKAAARAVILRGGTTGCTSAGGCNDANYTKVLQFKEGWVLTVLSHGGTGYMAGAAGAKYGDQVTAVVNAKPSIVIVEGSITDRYYKPADVQKAAASLFDRLRAQLPNAKVVVVGPAWAGANPPADVVGVERAVKAAAAGRVALFVDPIAEHWFTGRNASFVDVDHVSPTDQGHKLIATMIAKDIAPLTTSKASP
jgi:lysophospholipase L1-like esterase